MAQDSWPNLGHNSLDVDDAEYEHIAARMPNGVRGAPSDGAVVTAGSGLQVLIKANKRAVLRGHAWYSGSTDVPITVASNTSGSTRVDRVVLRLDRSDWTVTAVLKAGTAGAGPPPLTQDTGSTGVYEIQLAQVTVLNGASTVTVTREELYVGADSVRPATSTTGNLLPVAGELRYETDTGRWRGWSGTKWVTIFEDSGELDVSASVSGWSSSAGAVLHVVNGSAHLRCGIHGRTGAALGFSVESRLPLLIPTQYRHPTQYQYGVAYISNAVLGHVTLYPANNARAGQMWIRFHAAIGTGDDVAPSNISWAVT